ncbi:MAG: glutathione S-transferase family protein [Candidatus Midichloria sp.]|nr:glutathione S-transferase family protein [Candidatus Midichloria sp.]
MSWILYHYPLCPFSRKIRVILKEKGVQFELVLEKYWERKKSFLSLNPSGSTPVLLNKENNKVYYGNFSLFEFIEQNFLEQAILPFDYQSQYQVRNIAEWFDTKFYNEVTKYLIEEKVIKNASINFNSMPPNSSAIRAAKKNILLHLDYIDFLLKKNCGDYIMGEKVGLADFSAAAQLSVLDYMGDVPWEYSVAVKSWYALVKSRPSFRDILNDEVPGLYKSSHYENPDF